MAIFSVSLFLMLILSHSKPLVPLRVAPASDPSTREAPTLAASAPMTPLPPPSPPRVGAGKARALTGSGRGLLLLLDRTAAMALDPRDVASPLVHGGATAALVVARVEIGR